MTEPSWIIHTHPLSVASLGELFSELVPEPDAAKAPAASVSLYTSSYVRAIQIKSEPTKFFKHKTKSTFLPGM